MNFSKEITDSLTKNEKKLVDYIYQNLQQFPLMSIQDISKNTNISEATISRLPKHLGYKNFKEMKQKLAFDISPANKMTSAMAQEHSFSKYLMLQKDHLDRTIEYLNLDELNEIVDKIITGKTIYVFAKGASICLGELLAFRLRRFKKQVIIMPSSGSELFEILPMIKPDDFVILFGFMKTPIEGQVVLEFCKQKGIKTMLMTSRLIEDEKKLADYNIYVYRGEETVYHSMTVPVAVIDALIIEVAKVGGNEYMKSVDDIYQLKEKYKIKIQR